jgi:hypothetical protein
MGAHTSRTSGQCLAGERRTNDRPAWKETSNAKGAREKTTGDTGARLQQCMASDAGEPPSPGACTYIVVVDGVVQLCYRSRSQHHLLLRLFESPAFSSIRQ